MQPAFVVLFVAIVAIACAETVRHRLVKSCDPRLYDGPNVNLSNNSEGNMYEYQPPRPFQAELYFALKWDRNTDWFRNRVKVNLTIKCDGQVVYWGRNSLFRNFSPFESQLCVDKTLHAKLPCFSQCVLAFSWMVNATTFIKGDIVEFQTSQHEPIGVLNVTSAAVTKNSIVITWQVKNVLSCSKVVSLHVALNRHYNVSQHEFAALPGPLNVLLPPEWTQEDEPFFFNMSVQYCTNLGCSPFTQPLLLKWKPAESLPPPGDTVGDGGFLGSIVSTTILNLVLAAVCSILVAIVCTFCCCCWYCHCKKRRSKYQSHPNQILTLKEWTDVKELAYQQVSACAVTIPQDDKTEFTSLGDHSSGVPHDDSCSVSNKEDCIKRMPGVGSEDSSDSDSTTLLIYGPDHSNQLGTL